MTDALKIGDTVFLNSGSPPLRVEGIDGDIIEVSWDGDTIEVSWDVRVNGRFVRSSLRSTEPERTGEAA